MSFFTGRPVRLRGDSIFSRIIDYLQRKLRKDGRCDWERKYDQLMAEWDAKRKINGDEINEEWVNSIFAHHKKATKSTKSEVARESTNPIFDHSQMRREYQQRRAEIEENTRRRTEWQKQKDERLRELQYQYSEHGTHYEEIQRVRGMVNPY